MTHAVKTFVAAALMFLAMAAFAQEDREKQMDRIEGAGTVLSEIMAAPDKGIPEDILSSAKCVAIIPSMLKGGFVFGGEYGHGVASCRTANGWSAPAFFGVKTGTFGLQIGGQAVDLVMLIMNDRGMRNLLSSKFELGADASVAAGPVGRHTQGSTDWKLRAQVLTYSRSRGVFGGLTVKGGLIKQDKDDTRIFYGRMVPYRTLLTGGMPVPKDADPFISALNKYASPTKAEAEKTAQKAEPTKDNAEEKQ